MQNNKNKKQDRSSTVLVFTIVTTLILAGISFIPPQRIGAGEIKRANLLSDMVDFEDTKIFTKTSKDILDTSFLADLKDIDAVNEKIDSLNTVSEENSEQTLSTQPSPETETETEAKSETPTEEVTQQEPVEEIVVTEQKKSISLPLPAMADIEDFSNEGKMMKQFYEALDKESKERTVRVAVLGDSFIESDIITSDLRRNLQSTYGGDGVGFVQFADPLAKYRPTIEQVYDNWEIYSVMRKKNVPQELLDNFSVSGMLSIPLKEATTRFTSKSYKGHTSSATHAKILFKSGGNGSMEVRVNDEEARHYDITPDEKIQHIDIQAADGGKINSLVVSLKESDDFVGYGVVFEEATGVSVHNYGLRSNSGLALFSTDREVNRQIDELMNYDLVVLEYGLNVMHKDVMDYTYYGKQLRRLIAYIKSCFPNAAILVMSVGDVGVKNGAEVSSSPAIAPMIAEQRGAAYDQEVAFWNLYNAMGGENAMQTFVAQGWAAKDYTHINHRGGGVIADKLVQSFSKAIEQMNIPVIVEIPPLESPGEHEVRIGAESEIKLDIPDQPHTETTPDIETKEIQNIEEE